jgi:hypothetical protein
MAARLSVGKVRRVYGFIEANRHQGAPLEIPFTAVTSTLCVVAQSRQVIWRNHNTVLARRLDRGPRLFME